MSESFLERKKKKSQENRPLAEKRQDRKSKRTRQKNKRGDRKGEIKWKGQDSRQGRRPQTSPTSLRGAGKKDTHAHLQTATVSAADLFHREWQWNHHQFILPAQSVNTSAYYLHSLSTPIHTTCSLSVNTSSYWLHRKRWATCSHIYTHLWTD